MTRWKTGLALVLTCVWCFCNAPAQDLKEEWVQNISNAMDNVQARVKPAQSRKMLVFNLCNGFVHSSIPYGAKMLEIMGRKTGAFEIVSTEDIALFEPDNLKQFDAVVMNNSTGELFLPKNLGDLSQEQQQAARERDAALKQSLLDFVKSGRGIIGIHAATDCFYDWAEYGLMMGGYFNGHPWNEDVGVKLDDPAHPVVQAFKGRGFTVADEIYQFRDPYSRENLRVLLSLDVTKTNMKKDSIRRDDGDFAVSWVRGYGQGRVFYCSLGHREAVFWNVPVLRHYLDGIQFALGDLPADTTPSAQLSSEYLAESQQAGQAAFLTETLAELAAYEFGKPREAVSAAQEAVVEAGNTTELRPALEKQLVAVLISDATPAAKQFICKELSKIGSAQSVPTLADMLANEDTAAMARYALQRISDACAEQALAGALDKGNAALIVGVINSLGERALTYTTNDATVARIWPLAQHSDASIAAAAMAALGKIGGPAVLALDDAKASVPASLKPVWADAYLLCADKLRAAGDAGKAAAMCEELTGPGEAKQTRYAATEALMAALGATAAPRIIEVLSGDDLNLQRVAATAARTVPGEAATVTLAEALPKLAPSAQSLLLYALLDRGDPAALPAVTPMASSEDSGVRVAAAKCIAAIGDGSSVPVLAKAALSSDGTEQGAARLGLARLSGGGVDEAIVANLASSDAATRVELLRALAARNATATAPKLLDYAKDADESVRAAAFEALGRLAGTDQLPALVALAVGAQAGKTRETASQALAIVGRKAPEGQKTAAIVSALPATADAGAKAALISALGQIADPSALPALAAAARDSDAQVKAAGVRALAEWPTSAPVDDLLTVAETETDGGLQNAAVQGAVRLMALGTDREPKARAALYKRAMKAAKTVDQKKLVLKGIGQVGDPEAAPVVKACIENAELADAAKAAFDSLKKASFKGSASHGSGEAAKAYDGDINTRWTSGTSMKPDMWYVIDMGFVHKITGVTLDAGSSKGDYPRGYEVYVSKSNEDWGVPAAKGEGREALVDIAFAPTAGRYIKIVQTGSSGLFWSIHELKVATAD